MAEDKQDVRIRIAGDGDASACATIYAPYVTDTAVSFETDAPTAQDFVDRIRAANRRHIWLVAEVRGEVVGYAYGHEFHTRAAYRWTCETSIYLSTEHRGRGIGGILYGGLLTWLADAGYRRAVAGITLPNGDSFGIHRSLGFEECGRYRRVGWKNDAWHDVLWVQRDLQPAGSDVDPPVPPSHPVFVSRS